jgi:hypothetical protein
MFARTGKLTRSDQKPKIVRMLRAVVAVRMLMVVQRPTGSMTGQMLTSKPEVEGTRTGRMRIDQRPVETMSAVQKHWRVRRLE